MLLQARTNVSTVRPSARTVLGVGIGLAIAIAIVGGAVTLTTDPSQTVTLSNDHTYRILLSCEGGQPTVKPGKEVQVRVSILEPEPCFAYNDDLSTKNRAGPYVGCLFIDPFKSHGNTVSSVLQEISTYRCGNLGANW